MWKLIFLLFFTLTTTVHAQTHVLAFAGSTRSESINKKLVLEAANIARQAGAVVKVIDLKDFPMPFYDADVETKQGMPFNAKQFRQLLLENQVILIASPEYNGSLSAVLKNAIDWSSRGADGNPSREAFKGKKFVLMSASPSGEGGARGLAHLRSIIEGVGGTVIERQMTLPNAYTAFDHQGHLTDAKQKEELNQLITQAVK